jgi:hypothetical protein
MIMRLSIVCQSWDLWLRARGRPFCRFKKSRTVDMPHCRLRIRCFTLPVLAEPDSSFSTSLPAAVSASSRVGA